MNIRNLCVAICILFCNGLILSAQDYMLSDIDVKTSSKTLEYPFAGGLRAPQINTVDLNLDGIDDLLIFDREGNVSVPLIRGVEGGLTYQPEFRNILPEFNSWVLFRDYNNDGLKDIFCAPITVAIPGVQIYTAVNNGGQLEYELLEFSEFDFDILYYPVGNTFIQVFVSPADIPDVIDVDKDGDLDILAFEPSGSTIFYFQNMTVERDLPPGQIEYRVGESCYGGIFESGFSEAITLSAELGTCATALWDPQDALAQTRHAGSTVKSRDLNGDGLEDLLLGDVSYDGIVNLLNSGTNEQAWMTEQILRFPEVDQVEPVDIQLFVTTAFEDIDGDGVDEMIATPNSRSSLQGREHIWAYDIEIEEDSISNYDLISKNYFVDEMIYTGTMSAPLFFDYNNDGLTDLLIGTSGRSIDGIQIDPRMILYENTGSEVLPEFTIVNNDYLGMSEFSTTSRHFAPSIGDIDGDSDLDMVIGDETGRLYVVLNASSQADRFSWTSPQYDPWGIKVSAWAKPLIIDWNNDGLGDLILGEQNFNSSNGVLGSLNYFQNQGGPRNPIFNPDETMAPNNPVFGEVYTKQPGFINNFSAPAILDIGNRDLLAVGTERGNLFLYDSLGRDEGAVFVEVNAFLGNVREGAIGAPTFADIDNDQLLEMAIGTRRGGIAIYETDIKVDFGSTNNTPQINSTYIELSPNPVAQELQIEFQGVVCNSCLLQVWSVAGQLMSEFQLSSSKTTLDVAGLSNGLYFVRAFLDEGIITQKFVKNSNF